MSYTTPFTPFTVTTGNTAEIAKAVEDDPIDVGLVTMAVSGSSFEIIPVLKDEFVLIAPRNMPLPARITPDVLATMPATSMTRSSITRAFGSALRISTAAEEPEALRAVSS
jgi:DNA-binding transcriptional LysR family regulator